MLSLLLPGRHSETRAAASALRLRLGPEQALPEHPAVVVWLVMMLTYRQKSRQHSRLSAALHTMLAHWQYCARTCVAISDVLVEEAVSRLIRRSRFSPSS